jgi:hypothetical protein
VLLLPLTLAAPLLRLAAALLLTDAAGLITWPVD